MTNLTTGFLSVTPMRLKTRLTLAQMRDRFDATNPSKATLARGWGSVTDSAESVNYANVQPQPGTPTIWDGVDGRHPETLETRLYWYKPNRVLRREHGTLAEKALWHDLQIVDVLISPIDGSDDFTMLVTTHDPKEIEKEVLPALDRAIRGADDGAIISSNTSVLDLIDDDFFLWLLHRDRDKPKISNHLSIDLIRAMRSEGAMRYRTDLSKGIDLGRDELLALVAKPGTSFGPAKLVVIESDLGLRLDFELRVDGSYAVTTGQTEYTVEDGDEALPAFEERINATQDTAHIIIPALKNAYQRDRAWHGGGRDDFRAACRAALRASLDA